MRSIVFAAVAFLVFAGPVDANANRCDRGKLCGGRRIPRGHACHVPPRPRPCSLVKRCTAY